MRIFHTLAICAAYSLIFPATGHSANSDMPAPTDTPAARRAALAAVCAKTSCRPGSRKIDLRMPEENALYGFETGPLPYLDPAGEVIIYPGETIVVSLTKGDAGQTVLKLVSVTDPDGAVQLGTDAQTDFDEATLFAFRFVQAEDKPDMNLVATNHTDMNIKFSAWMAVPTKDGIRQFPTTVCTVLASTTKDGFFGDETWPHPIAMLILSDFHTAPASMDCS